MSHLKYLILPALLGLVAGMGHGFIAHSANLPVSLTDQFFQALQPSNTWKN